MASTGEDALKPKNIGLLGGSFNPAHEGHREISVAALSALQLDEIWWLVSPGNPLKDKDQYADYNTRLEQAKQMASHPLIKISNFEQARNLTYTIDTISALKKHYTDYSFVWVIGADNLEEFHLWKDWEAIFAAMPIAVMNRPGYEHAVTKSIAAKKFQQQRHELEIASALCEKNPPAWIFIPETQNPISSTQIRSRMSSQHNPSAPSKPKELQHFLDFNPSLGDFKSDVLDGLSKPQKSLSPKYFYDEKGSGLFSQITTTKDYYPTRTELSLMKANLNEICEAIGPKPSIFEYGSGASEKIRLLIENLDQLQTYVAMDISRDYLLDSATTIAHDYPHIKTSAICADFQQNIPLPEDFHPDVDNWTGYFPGSTIGNFAPGTVQSFFNRVSNTLGAGSKFFLGVDLIKDKDILTRAYNDSDGITAAFNLNLLHRMKGELGATINIDDFEHLSFYNETDHRIEMHLRAIRNTQITLEDKVFDFSDGETLLTEYSYKYTKEIMQSMLKDTPWQLTNYWTDSKGWFGACLLSNIL